MHTGQTVYKTADWVEVTHDTVQLWAVINIEMGNLELMYMKMGVNIPQRARNFMGM
jgi:hypothetical protein